MPGPFDGSMGKPAALDPKAEAIRAALEQMALAGRKDVAGKLPGAPAANAAPPAPAGPPSPPMPPAPPPTPAPSPQRAAPRRPAYEVEIGNAVIEEPPPEYEVIIGDAVIEPPPGPRREIATIPRAELNRLRGR